MLWALFVILLALWMVGIASSYTFGGYIHMLLGVALLAAVIQLSQGKRRIGE